MDKLVWIIIHIFIININTNEICVTAVPLFNTLSESFFNLITINILQIEEKPT